jgi:peptide methionine sulfoxide reductase msrA/msrB
VNKTIYLAGGCFWGLEKFLGELVGVLGTRVGYANAPGAARGVAGAPVTYEEVCASSGHVEAVELVYDPAVAPLRFYLEQVFQVIDPTAVNRQGGDVGVQYRTGVYWVDPADQLPVELELATLQRRFAEPIAVEAGPLCGFTPAEDYHQRYLDKNPGGYCHISPAALAAARSARPQSPAQPAPASSDAVASAPVPSSGAQPAPAGSALAAVTAPAAAHAAADSELAALPGPAADVPAAQVPADPGRVAALSSLQRAVTQEGATEPPFTGEYDQVFDPGIYVDVTSGQPLFVSSEKFDAGCGWPSFARPITPEVVEELADSSYGMRRTEVRSAGSGAHLGHVFNDGPKASGGLRYCINSAALEFVPLEQMSARGYAAYLPLVTQVG